MLYVEIYSSQQQSTSKLMLILLKNFDFSLQEYVFYLSISMKAVVRSRYIQQALLAQ